MVRIKESLHTTSSWLGVCNLRERMTQQPPTAWPFVESQTFDRSKRDMITIGSLDDSDLDRALLLLLFLIYGSL